MLFDTQDDAYPHRYQPLFPLAAAGTVVLGGTALYGGCRYLQCILPGEESRATTGKYQTPTNMSAGIGLHWTTFDKKIKTWCLQKSSSQNFARASSTGGRFGDPYVEF